MTVENNLTLNRYFRKIYALPSEHGAWVWWIGPFFLGTAAGGAPSLASGSPTAASGSPTAASLALFLAALTAFLSRQPTTLLVKVLSKRRPASDLGPSLFWMLLYGATTMVIVAILVRMGYSRLLWLAVPGIPVFAWHLSLVRKRAERGQQGIELVGSGVLALVAPAAYWIAGGAENREAWILWGLSWLQSAASIVFIYLRLEQRTLEQMPSRSARWRMGARTLAYYGFNLALSGGLALSGLVPPTVVLAFGLVLGDALEGVAHPPAGKKPSAIGLRQLAFSTLFFVVMSLGYLV